MSWILTTLLEGAAPVRHKSRLITSFMMMSELWGRSQYWHLLQLSAVHLRLQHAALSSLQCLVWSWQTDSSLATDTWLWMSLTADNLHSSLSARNHRLRLLTRPRRVTAHWALRLDSMEFGPQAMLVIKSNYSVTHALKEWMFLNGIFFFSHVKIIDDWLHFSTVDWLLRSGWVCLMWAQQGAVKKWCMILAWHLYLSFTKPIYYLPSSLQSQPL